MQITLILVAVGLACISEAAAEASMTTRNNGSELTLCTATGACLTISNNSTGASTVPCAGPDVIVQQGQCVPKESGQMKTMLARLEKVEDENSQLKKQIMNQTTELSTIKTRIEQVADDVVNLTKQQTMTNGILNDPTDIKGNYENTSAPPFTWLIDIPHAFHVIPPEWWSDEDSLLHKFNVYNLGGAVDLVGQRTLTAVKPDSIQAPFPFTSRKALRLVSTESSTDAGPGTYAYPGVCFQTPLGSGGSLRIRFIARLPVGFSFQFTGNYARHRQTHATLGTGKWEYYSFNVHKPLDSSTPIPHTEGAVWVSGPKGKTLTYDLIDYQVEMY